MEMKNKTIHRYTTIVILLLSFSGCQVFNLPTKTENKNTPENYNNTSLSNSQNTAQINWKEYFTDPYLIELIDTALKNNQELNIILQEIEIAKNEVRAKKGEYLPFLDLGGSAGLDKVGSYTRNGAVEENLEVN